MSLPPHSSSIVRFAPLAVAASLVIGCESSTSPDSDLALLLAASEAADGFEMDVQEMRGPGVPGFSFPRFRFPSVDGSVPDCPEEGRRFRCATREEGGLAVSRTVTFYDGNGDPQDAYDDQATATVVFELSMSGSLMGRRGTGTMDRTRTLTASGLEGEETTVTWNGSGTSVTTRGHEDPAGRSFALDVASESVIRDVVVPSPQTEEGWPLSGTITRAMDGTATRAGETQAIDVVSTVTFNGTSTVEIQVGDESFDVDLSEGRGFGRRVRHRRP